MAPPRGTVDPRRRCGLPSLQHPTWRSIMAKKFLFVSLGILALAVAYNLWATRTEAQQAGSTFAGISVDANGQSTTAITTAGDVYARGAVPTCNGTWADASGCDS